MGGLKEASRIWSDFSGDGGLATDVKGRVCKTWKNDEEVEKACKARRKVEREGIEVGEAIRASPRVSLCNPLPV